MQVRKLGETASAIILGWDAVPNAKGYVFYVDGGRSHTFDGSITSVRVSKSARHVDVQAIGILDEGAWEPAAVPPTEPWVDPPLPPAVYSVPTTAVSVASLTQLEQAASGPNPDIVLEDGVYERDTYLGIVGKRLYARHLGGVTLRMGVWGRGGERLQGLRFDVPSNSRCLQESILRLDGSHTVLDCWLSGQKQVAHGLYGLSPDNAEVRRLKVNGFTDTGIRLSSNHEGGLLTIKAISDLDIDWVTRPVVNSSNGTAEAGLWVGEYVVGGVQRVKVRTVSWSGIEGVNNCNATVFSNLDIDMSGILKTGLPNCLNATRVAFYGEHFVNGLTIEDFVFAGMRTGFVGEWADPVWGSRPAAVNVKIRHGAMKDGDMGVYFDEGSGPGNAVGDVQFERLKVAVGEFKPKKKASLTGLTYKDVVTQYSDQHYGGL